MSVPSTRYPQKIRVSQITCCANPRVVSVIGQLATIRFHLLSPTGDQKNFSAK